MLGDFFVIPDISSSGQPQELFSLFFLEMGTLKEAADEVGVQYMDGEVPYDEGSVLDE